MLIRRSGKHNQDYVVLHSQRDLGCASLRQRLSHCTLLQWYDYTVTRSSCGWLSQVSLLMGAGLLMKKTFFVSKAGNSGHEVWQCSSKTPWYQIQPNSLWLVKSHGNVTQGMMMILKVSESFLLGVLFWNHMEKLWGFFPALCVEWINSISRVSNKNKHLKTFSWQMLYKVCHLLCAYCMWMQWDI